MTSVVDIANSALVRVGEDAITALTEDTETARIVNAQYELVRDRVLRMHPWNSVTTRAVLAPLSPNPAWGFDRGYQIPADCLRVLEVDTLKQWRVEGRAILTDEGDVLNIRYIRRETDPNEYDSLLIDAISIQLAMELVERVTQSNTKKQLLMDDWKRVMRFATRADAQEGSSIPDATDDWILARL